MPYDRKVTLYTEGGTKVVARKWYENPKDSRVEAFITKSRRVIWCQGGDGGIFWFQDTDEKLYIKRPSSPLSSADRLGDPTCAR